jgi:hypothetical protein
MRLKPGVRVLGIKPELLLAIMIAERAFHPNELVITSLMDGTHSRGSEHYTGMAFDARTRDVAESRAKELAHSIGAALGSDYDVILEPSHLHIEYDPKAPY